MPFNQKPQKFNAKINTVTVGTGPARRGSPRSAAPAPDGSGHSRNNALKSHIGPWSIPPPQAGQA